MATQNDVDFPVTSTLETAEAHEQIRGPIYGYWLASYAIERPRGWYAYGKLCRGSRPPSVWDTPTAFAKLSIGPRDTALDALEAIVMAVQSRLERRPENQPTQPLSGVPPLAD